MEHCLSPVICVPTRQNVAFSTHELRVEVSVLKGLQNLSLTGLPSEVLRDARDKIRAVLHNSVSWDPLERLVVHLSPQEIPKTGSHLEVPIILACWVALQSELRENPRILSKLSDYRFYGSVDLSGRISRTPASSSLEDADDKAVGPQHFSHLKELFTWVRSNTPLPQVVATSTPATREESESIFVEGRWTERLALFASAVVGEPTLLVGPPGVGKTHLGKWCRSWYMNTCTQSEHEKDRIWKAAGYEKAPRVPDLNPHARTHVSEFLGYRKVGRTMPGLFSLAHGGLMVLDEFPELARDVREIFRNVLDQKELRRFNGHEFSTWPADFWLVATANPCACGQARPRDLSKCRCTRGHLVKYLDRFSGPLLDRFGVQLFVHSTETPEVLELIMDPSMNRVRELLSSSPQVLSQKLLEAQKKFKQRPLLEGTSRHDVKTKRIEIALEICEVPEAIRKALTAHLRLPFLNSRSFR